MVLFKIGGALNIAGTAFANDARDLVHESGTWRRKRDTC